MKVFI